jgi:hypothetical protein
MKLKIIRKDRRWQVIRDGVVLYSGRSDRVLETDAAWGMFRAMREAGK